MFNKMIRNVTFTLLSLSLFGSANASTMETRESDQALTVYIHNYTDSILSLSWAGLQWGRWGMIPSEEIKPLYNEPYSIKGKVLSGFEGNVVYNFLDNDVRLEVYTAADHFSPQTFEASVCLRNSISSECKSRIGDYEVKKVRSPKEYSKVSHRLDIYLKNIDHLSFNSLCSNVDFFDRKLINGIIATSGKALNLPEGEYNRFITENNSVINIESNNENQKIITLDMIKTAYLAGMRITYCFNSRIPRSPLTFILRK